jgi:hypothetical protein
MHGPPLFARTFATFPRFLDTSSKKKTAGWIMSEASGLWFARVEKAVEDLHNALEEQRRVFIAQAALRTELWVAILKAQVANDATATRTFRDAKAA